MKGERGGAMLGWAKVVQNFVVRSQLSKVRLPVGVRQPLSSATPLLAQGTGLSEQWPWWEGWKLCRASLSPRLILLHLLRNPPVLKGPASPESSVWHYLSRKLNSPWGPSWIGQRFSLWELNMTPDTSLVPAPVPKNAWLTHVGLSQRCLRQRRWQQCTTYIWSWYQLWVLIHVTSTLTSLRHFFFFFFN